jgi:hypothetical protein
MGRVATLVLDGFSFVRLWQESIRMDKPSEDILEEALRITGPADQDFRRTAEMWSGLFRDMLKDGVSFEPYHIAQAMILLKMSRQLHQRKRDNWVDTAGYARCGQVCDQAEQERNDVK